MNTTIKHQATNGTGTPEAVATFLGMSTPNWLYPKPEQASASLGDLRECLRPYGLDLVVFDPSENLSRALSPCTSCLAVIAHEDGDRVVVYDVSTNTCSWDPLLGTSYPMQPSECSLIFALCLPYDPTPTVWDQIADSADKLSNDTGMKVCIPMVVKTFKCPQTTGQLLEHALQTSEYIIA